MVNPEHKTIRDVDFDDDLFDESSLSSDIDSDFDMLSEEELNSLFDDSEGGDSDEALPDSKNPGANKKDQRHLRLPDDWKDFDFGDDDDIDF